MNKVGTNIVVVRKQSTSDPTSKNDAEAMRVFNPGLLRSAGADAFGLQIDAAVTRRRSATGPYRCDAVTRSGRSP